MITRIYWFLLVAVALTGGGMLAASMRHPWYTVSEQEIVDLSERLADTPRDVRWREWYEERPKLDTARKELSDTGTGLVALAAILAVLRLLSGFPLPDARAPKWHWLFIVAYLAALAIQVPCSFCYYSIRQSRFEYPTWGDSIIIGIGQTFMVCVVLGVIGCLLWWPFLAKARFPAPLFVWPPDAETIQLDCKYGHRHLRGAVPDRHPGRSTGWQHRWRLDVGVTRVPVPLIARRIGSATSRENELKKFRTIG